MLLLGKNSRCLCVCVGERKGVRGVCRVGAKGMGPKGELMLLKCFYFFPFHVFFFFVVALLCLLSLGAVLLWCMENHQNMSNKNNNRATRGSIFVK